MELPAACGPVSQAMVDAVIGARSAELPTTPAVNVLRDRDQQLALWMAYELFYRGFDEVDEGREWDPDVLGLRAGIERRFEQELRDGTAEHLATAPREGSIGDRLLQLVADDDGPRLSAYLRREASGDQMRDFFRERSLQQLKESDPQSFLLPRLEGAAKVALAEIQYDEYGAGNPKHLHQRLFGDALAAIGLDSSYGAYVAEVSAVSLASANVMSLFALNRRLRACGIGHFAAFEASSSVPSRRIAAGLERLEMPSASRTYFLEHVEADSIHEQVAARDLCGAFVEGHPDLEDEVMFGAACALLLDRMSGDELMAQWSGQDRNQGWAS